MKNLTLPKNIPLLHSFVERVQLFLLVVPLTTIFLTFLSYVSLYGSLNLTAYINGNTEVQEQLKSVLTVMYGFTLSFLILNGIAVCWLWYNARNPFGRLSLRLVSKHIFKEPNDPVKKELDLYFQQIIRSGRRQKHWKSIYLWGRRQPIYFLLPVFLFISAFICIVQSLWLLCTMKATAYMLLNPTIIAMLLYECWLLTDADFLILNYVMSFRIKESNNLSGSAKQR